MAVARTQPWRFLLTLALHGEVAAVDDQLGAGDIRRLVRGEEQHGVSDLFHPSLSLHRHGPERLRPPLRIGRHLGRPHRRHDAGVHRVDPDAALAYCTAADFVLRRTAPFQALYPMWILSWPTNPEIAQLLTMAPPPACRMAGTACFIPRKTPLAFTSMRVSQAAELSVSGSNVPLMPALLTRTWSLPKLTTVVAMAARQSASRVTSRFTKHASPPVLAMSAATWDPSASRRSPTTTFAPSLAKIVASLRPIPLARPAIIPTFPPSLIRSPAPHPAPRRCAPGIRRGPRGQHRGRPTVRPPRWGRRSSCG